MIWTMKDGTEIPTEKMTHEHRVNSINKIIRDKKPYTHHIRPEMYDTPEESLFIINKWLEVVVEHNYRAKALKQFGIGLEYLTSVDWRD